MSEDEETVLTRIYNRVEAAARGDEPAPARDAGEVVEAIRVCTSRYLYEHNGAPDAAWYREGLAEIRDLARVALSAYDAPAPDVRSVGTLSEDLTAAASALSDAAAVRDAALEEAANLADKLRHPDGYSSETEDWCEGTRHAAHAIRALRSSPPPEPVTEEEIAAVLSASSRAENLGVSDLDTLEGILAFAYSKEINVTISSFWDGGFEVSLGDQMNGIKGTVYKVDVTDIGAEVLNLIRAHCPWVDIPEPGPKETPSSLPSSPDKGGSNG